MSEFTVPEPTLSEATLSEPTLPEPTLSEPTVLEPTRPRPAGPGPAAPGAAPARLDPPYLFADYRSTVLRSPSRALIVPPPGRTELTGPAFGDGDVRDTDADLTAHGDAEPIGERIIVHGRVTDASGRPVQHTLVEVWQANAAGRYVHPQDQHPAPLDPNFVGAGRCLTDADGAYRFVTIKPGPYPWRNHHNAWRPAHIHFSVFGRAFTQRLITQMYFPGDPLFFQDPIYNAVRDERVRRRMISRYDHAVASPHWATGYRFDIVLDGADASVFEEVTA